MKPSPVTLAIREAIYPFNSRIEVITALCTVLMDEQRSYHKTMEKTIALEEIVAGLRLKTITSKKAKAKKNKPSKRG